jgi:hypothetical protein
MKLKNRKDEVKYSILKYKLNIKFNIIINSILNVKKLNIYLILNNIYSKTTALQSDSKIL